VPTIFNQNTDPLPMQIPLPSFNQLKKNLKKPSSGKMIKIALLSDSASQFVNQAITGYGIEKNINYQIFEADYNQIERQIFDFTSELYQYQPEYVIILKSSEKVLKEFYTTPCEEKAAFSEDYVKKFGLLLQTLQSNLKCKIIINNIVELNDGVFGNFGNKTKFSVLYQIKKINLMLMELSQGTADLFMLDLDGLVKMIGHYNSFDPKMYYNADMVLNLDVIPQFSKNVHDVIQAIEGNFKKCVILDLDNTMWGGIIGDDGIEGIQIGDLGLGKIFTDFQLWIKQLKERGIIIAVCSKNTEAIAKEPFQTHPQMILKLTDISVFVANWENKADNIRDIQKILDIGLDSIVFIDDNPFERELIKKEIPQITVPNLPEDPAEYLMYLKALNLFETASFINSDVSRTLQYQQQTIRADLKKKFTNEEEFLANLEMSCVVAPLNAFTIPRVAQLSQRSNQFNLRTVRYTEQDLARLQSQPGYTTLSFTLTDKFGENGLIAFVILKELKPDTLFVENWAMSCRVLRRGMENFMLNCITEHSLLNGYKYLVGEYLPNTKNMMVKDHYQTLGFDKQTDGTSFLNLTNYSIIKTYINKAS
jgi:FkbH-like protein